MGAKQSKVSKQSSKISFYVEGESRIPQPGMRLKSERGIIYHLIKLISETENSFNFLAIEWTPSIVNNNLETYIQELNNQANNEKIYVVKFIKLLRDKIHMVENEITMMKTFAKIDNQKHIIECFDYFVNNKTNVYPYVCIVTPYAKGGALLNYLHYFRQANRLERSSSENTIKKIMYQLLEALDYLHTNNVVHRDLNLKNIYLTNEILSENSNLGHVNDIDPIVVLADFGCSTYIDDKENCDEIDSIGDEINNDKCDEGCDHCKDQIKRNSEKNIYSTKQSNNVSKNHNHPHEKKYVLNQLVGTPVFIAPEMYEEKPYDSEVDMWSLGIVFYALMSGGVSPFPSSSSMDVMKWVVIHKQIEYPEEVFGGFSDSAMSLLRMMLTKDPSKRISAREALKHPWFTNEI